MLAKKMFILILFPVILFASNDSNQNFYKKEIVEIIKPPKKKRYRLRDNTKNYFDIQNDRIQIDVPLTSRKLRITNTAVNISSNNINAVLIWIKSRDSEITPCDGQFIMKSKRIRLSKFRGLKAELSSRREKKLLIAFWVDEEPPIYVVENEFREMVRTSESYEEAVEKINQGNCDGKSPVMAKHEIPMRPSESGGDVIGGNG